MLRRAAIDALATRTETDHRSRRRGLHNRRPEPLGRQRPRTSGNLANRQLRVTPNHPLVLRTSIGFARPAPQEWAKSVRVPTFLYQVRDDTLTEPSDVQTMF
jgi:hypothetical protein